MADSPAAYSTSFSISARMRPRLNPVVPSSNDKAWGSMVSSSYGFLQLAPWAAIVPGVAIALTVLGFNLLGDGLRDILDPRQVKR